MVYVKTGRPTNTELIGRQLVKERAQSMEDALLFLNGTHSKDWVLGQLHGTPPSGPHIGTPGWTATRATYFFHFIGKDKTFEVQAAVDALRLAAAA